MNTYATTTWTFKFTREKLYFDYKTNQFVVEVEKSKRSFAGVSPFKAARMIIKSEAAKGSKVVKFTAMYSRNSKQEWRSHAEH